MSGTTWRNLRLFTTLESLGVTCAIGGSLAAMMYSEPRFTFDVDLMVSAPLQQFNQLVREVESWQVYITPFEAIVETNLADAAVQRSIRRSSRADCASAELSL